MFQSIAVWLLKNYVGEYIENLNADQLTIGYGGIELENLSLKPSAFRRLKLPIKLLSGEIGRLNLVIPYANPSTEPWIIKIEKLHLVVEFENVLPNDEESDKEVFKRSKLDKLEAEWKANKAAGSKSSWWSNSWFPSLYSSISTKIAENLQLDIKDVQVQYICPQMNLSFGIKIESLSAHTTNDEWKKSTKNPENKMKFKLMELEGLSLYSHSRVLASNGAVKDFQDVKYILGPVYAEARIQRNGSKVSLKSNDGPRFFIELKLEDVLLSLTEKQYRVLVDLGEDISRYFRSLGHSHLRPEESVMMNPKAWWKFAIHSVIEPIKERNQHLTKDFIMRRVTDINQYVALYNKHLLATLFNQKEKDALKEIEENMKFEEVACLRRIVYSKFEDKENITKIASSAPPDPATTTWSGWIMSFNPLRQSAEQSPVNMQVADPFSMTKEEEKFLDELTEMSNEGESLFNRDSIFAMMVFTLSSGSLLLTSEDKRKDVLNMCFNGLDIISEVRSKSKSWEWTMSLQTFKIRNPNTDDKMFPTLMGPQVNESDPTNEENFLTIRFGQKRLHRNCSYSLVVNMQPSNVIYDFALVAEVKEFLTIVDNSKYNFKFADLESMTYRFQEAVNTQIRELKLATKAEFDNAVAGSRKRFGQEQDEWRINLDIAAPRIILPVKFYDEEIVNDDLCNKMLILNLGRLEFYNDHAKCGKNVTDDDDDRDDDDSDEFVTPSSTTPSEEDIITMVDCIDSKLDISEIMEKFYDSYTLELSMVQVLVSNIGKNCILQKPKGFGPDHIIEEFSVSFSLKRRIIFTTDPDLPALTLSTVLPQLYVHIDHTKLQVLFQNIQMFRSTLSSKTAPPVENSITNVEDMRGVSSANLFEVNLQDLLTESKLVLAKFNFEKLSLGLHSRGRCFAELQIEGVECEFVKRPHDLSVSFILSSLLLIDAMQTFGAEYELLISSKSSCEHQNDDVLIHICYQMINADCPSLGNSETTPVQLLSINFNALHINGNLKTIVELHNVINQVLTQQKKSMKLAKSQSFANRDELENNLKKDGDDGKIEITAYFKQIDLLLFYTVKKELRSIPQKVAKIAAGDLQFNTTMGKSPSSSGGIGSIAVTDLSQNSLPHKQIFSVGSGIHSLNHLNIDVEESEAFTFHYVCEMCEINELPKKKLNIQMASAYYMHNPYFLKQVSLCVGDFKQYAYNLAKSLQMAASDMAKSMVTVKRHVDEISFQQSDILREIELVDIPNDIEKDTTSPSRIHFSVSVETPIIYFPSNLLGLDLVVFNLGKITANNSYFVEIDEQMERQETDRLTLEIQRINLSVIKLTQESIDTVVSKDIQLFSIVVQKNSNQTVIIHNTDLFLQADKISTSSGNACSNKLLKNNFQLNGKVNSALKLFLSVPAYQQMLSTINFASDIRGDKLPSSPLSTATSPSSEEALPSVAIDDTISEGEEVNPDIGIVFEMPSLQLELHGELDGKEHGFANILCDNFYFVFTNESNQGKILKISLQDFSIRDLLHKNHDKYSYLIRSREPCDSSSYPSNTRTCVSCPENYSSINFESFSKSVPNMLHTYDNFSLPSSCSDLSILSKQQEDRTDIGPFIFVEIVFADKDEKKETQIHKKLNIDVNCVDAVINLQTWVILFEFFGIGVPKTATSPLKTKEPIVSNWNVEQDAQSDEPGQTDWNVNVKSLVFYVNKEEYPLAKASVDNLKLNMGVLGENQDVNGSIGSIELQDLSPNSGLFTERLTTLGDKAFKFEFYRYGEPDPNLTREYDMKLSLHLSSIQYVHTQRFLIECISFCQHFLFLQEVLGRMRAASAGNEVLAVENRGARVRLKISTDAPILVLPRCSSSRDLLVANLGKLDVENEFLYASNPTTEAYNFIATRSRHNGSIVPPVSQKTEDRLLDCIKVKLSHMQVFSAVKLADGDQRNSEMFERQGSEMMREPCSLNLRVERNIEWAFGRQVPDMLISGRLSSVFVNIDLAQYGQIMGMLSENLGEPLDTFTAPSTVLVDPLVMGLPSKQLWTTLQIKVHLSNVSIEATPQFSFGSLKSHLRSTGKLARFDLIQSDLLFESFSDGSKSIDLSSSDVLIHDIRYNGNCGILLPSYKGKRKEDYLQFEIHYLDTKEKSHLTFLCNQSRILLQFHFILDTYRFIMRKEEEDFQSQQKKPTLPKPSSPRNHSDTHGILMKPTYQSAAAAPKKMFECKVNVTESELVVVEDIFAIDTRTVILKTTAVFVYRPDNTSERPFSCSLQSLEIFSCHLNQPDDSALSIVDPVAFLVELRNGKKPVNQCSQGLLDAVKPKPVLEIQFQVPVYLRLSYHDVQMFLQMINSAKEQISNAWDNDKEADVGSLVTEKLLRFESDSEKSYSSPRGVSLKEALSAQENYNPANSPRLIHRQTRRESRSGSSTPSSPTSPPDLKSNDEKSHAISGFEVKATFISVTLIDDCGNNEVPLIELSLSDMLLHHNYEIEWKGLSNCHLDADYYNTRVSAWEPLIEGWKFNVHWSEDAKVNQPSKTIFKLDAPDRLDINLTNAFIGIANQTVDLWTSRFYVDASSKEKKRAPFLPFLLRNKTGCKLTFHTIMKSPAKISNKRRDTQKDNEFEVEANGEVAFSFEGRGKHRHQTSHQLMVHQIILKIAGKYDIQPITVDRVGQFFRIAYASECKQQDSSADGLNDVYLIIDIGLEGARKVLTVKSALSIHNNLTIPIEIIGRKNEQHYNLAVIAAKDNFIVPLPLVQCSLYCRPIKGNTVYQLSDEIRWKEVATRGEKGFIRSCRGEANNLVIFRFCATVQCIGFPKANEQEMLRLNQPEHVITINHHILIYNQLPFDLFYTLRGNALKDIVKPGDKIPVHLKDESSPVEIGFSFENFPHYDTIKIPYEDEKYILPVRVYDMQRRVLILHAIITCRSGSMLVSLYAPYWLINKTGLPLVFRREDDSAEMAGQFSEHEAARSLTPLPFSFSTNDDNFNCQVRVGKRYHPNGGMTPLWSKPFSLERENDARTLYVRERRDLPEKGFNVGIVMTWGKGVYSLTKIISFVSRFQINNQTTKILCVTQKSMINDDNPCLTKGTICQRDAITIFHWPRCDLDMLLCVRVDDKMSLWSGSIKIDRETTFHLNVKSNGKNSNMFFRVHISSHAGTFRATFMDAKSFPPPYRLINLSDVALFYWQENNQAVSSLSTTFIKAKEAKDYVLDEPLMPAKLVISAYQESNEVYDLKQNGKHQVKLYYKNPIFIAFSHTFKGKCLCKHMDGEYTGEQLVLDVTDHKHVVISRKADHKRSQLWRMNANGNLVHFESAAIKERRKSFISNSVLVLDIDDSKNCDRYPLILSPLNQNRKKTQTWFFESNVLRCCVSNFVVQLDSKCKENSRVALALKPTSDYSIMNYCIKSLRLRPGSGVLSANVYSQGPTQILEISDSQQENARDNWMMIDHSIANISAITCKPIKERPSTEVTLSLASGFGISFINLQPEEVLFMTISQISFNLDFNELQYFADLEIGRVQVDNQLFGCQSPIAIYASPSKKNVLNNNIPDVKLDIKVEKDDEYDLLVFKHFSINLCPLIIMLDDRLLLKMIQGVHNLMIASEELPEEPSSIFDSHKIDERKEDSQKKLFFEEIMVNQGDLTVSLNVTGKIDKDLFPLKVALGFPLVSFESAVIGFEKYKQSNVFDTAEHLLDHVLQYYKATFKNQAAVLLGSLDILGNPMGLIQDFSSGIEGLLKKGNLGGLFVNVAHGFSDSAAKMTGVIADGLWSASMDNKFLESRDSLRVYRDSSSSTHFSAGLRGLGMGFIGGLTSMVTQPIEGATNKGVSGFFAGIGKGLVGTVAKPVAGVFDLASGTAAAVRNTTETAASTPRPVRVKRNCYGPGGILGKYSKMASDGQEILLKFNDGNTDEKYVGMESVRSSADRLKALFTNKGIYFVKSGPPCSENIKLHVEYSFLLDSNYLYTDRQHIIEIFFCNRQSVGVRKPSVINRTTVLCDNERIGFKVCEKINYLKSLHLESLYVMPDVPNS